MKTPNCTHPFLVAALLAGACAAAAPDSGPVLLRFKPTAGKDPAVYDMQTQTINRATASDGVTTRTYTSKKLVARQASDAGKGTLSIQLLNQATSFEVDGKVVEQADPQDDPSSAATVVTSTGQTISGGLAIPGQSGGVEFVLPAKPVAIGGSWEASAPARAEFPVVVKTIFKLREFRDIDKRHCAIVSSTTDIDQALPERHVAVYVKQRGDTAFDTAGGQIVQAVSSTVYRVKFLAANKANLVETETETKRRLKLVK